jgi:hypothetical protein
MPAGAQLGSAWRFAQLACKPPSHLTTLTSPPPAALIKPTGLPKMGPNLAISQRRMIHDMILSNELTAAKSLILVDLGTLLLAEAAMGYPRLAGSLKNCRVRKG